MYPEAIAAFRKAASVAGNNAGMVTLLGHAYAVSGDKKQAEDALRELKNISQTRYIPALYTAVIYMGLGDKDKAFQWLDKAYNERTDRLIYVNADPITDPLRSDPRFQTLLHRIGLPQQATTARPL
jgi:Flp pilus assembly protein TadD